MTNTKFLLALSFLAFAVSLHAQEVESMKTVFSVSAGLNSNQSWEMEPSVSYYFCPYIGCTLGLNITNQYNQIGYSGTVSGNGNLHWEIEDSEASVTKFLFRPAINLRTPILWLDQDHDTGLTFQLEPGLYMAAPVNDRVTVLYRDKEHVSSVTDSKRLSNNKGDWLFWNIRSAISLHIDRFIISSGYSISNFDIYSGRRNILIEGVKLDSKLPKREYTNSFFLSLGYSF